MPTMDLGSRPARHADHSGGKLEVHGADRTVKVYSKGSWATVDGKPLEPGS